MFETAVVNEPATEVLLYFLPYHTEQLSLDSTDGEKRLTFSELNRYYASLDSFPCDRVFQYSGPKYKKRGMIAVIN